jgi:hypothetical protein
MRAARIVSALSLVACLAGATILGWGVYREIRRDRLERDCAAELQVREDCLRGRTGWDGCPDYDAPSCSLLRDDR